MSILRGTEPDRTVWRQREVTVWRQIHPDYTLLDNQIEDILWEQEGMSLEGQAQSSSVPSMCATHVSSTSCTLNKLLKSKKY